MKQQKEKQLPLADTLPSFAKELELLLTQKGGFHLAAQVPGLHILERCRCGDDFCAMFYVQPKPTESYGPNHRCVPLEPEEEMLILDIVDEVIASVEILDRGDIRQTLLSVLP
jgi:hypothetical protein